MKKDTFTKQVNINNRKASFEYYFEDKYIAGMVLTGTEIKSIRQSKVNLQDAFCYFAKDGLWVKQMHISLYENGTYNNHNAVRERKLLLKKKELKKIQKRSDEVGITVIPTRLFINDKGLAKLEIAVAKGKKLYDKRETLKEKDQKREMDRAN
ncbi:MAG: SsrA-binding protein SmpB [Bacteroidetes bacterium]|nr:MAG: SsrA-binding protein SmpB [Bacteroidota bacterium]